MSFLNSVTVQHWETSEERFGEEIYLIEAEVNTAIKSLKAGKAPGEDDIRPKMLKAMNNFVVRFQVVWKTSEVPKQWQTNVLIPIRGGVETRCFETETRRDTRLYINCFNLSQGCGVRVGS